MISGSEGVFGEAKVTEYCAVPSEGADEGVLLEFAHTYDLYRQGCGLGDFGAIVRESRAAWEQSGELPEDLSVLRGCLFYQAKAHYFDGGLTRFDTLFVRGLVNRIRVLAGDAVEIC